MQRAKGEQGLFTIYKEWAEGDSTCAPDYKLQTTDATTNVRLHGTMQSWHGAWEIIVQ
jgi:hypothetical protein